MRNMCPRLRVRAATFITADLYFFLKVPRHHSFNIRLSLSFSSAIEPQTVRLSHYMTPLSAMVCFLICTPGACSRIKDVLEIASLTAYV